MITTAGGMWLAPGSPGVGALWAAVLGTAFIVGSANALNCWIERDLDRLMKRTANRPLPAGRLQPRVALGFGIALAVMAIPILAFLVNPLTALVGASALVTYVAIYTPMKQRSPAALLVGAVPGALPPLMGWTAITGRIDTPAIVLFGILFLWQLPHFIAISLFRKRDYSNAGMKVLPAVRGDAVAKRHAIFWAAALLPVSLLLVPLGVAGNAYLVIASVFGVGYLGMSLRGLRKEAGPKWARKLFIFSILYLTVVFAALMIDAV
jgi:protoheme IX farnesyltransferase